MNEQTTQQPPNPPSPTNPPTANPTTEQTVRHVPYERFAEVNGQLSATKAERDAHAKALAEERAAREAAQRELVTTRYRLSADLALTQAGILDPEVQDLFRERHERKVAQDGDKAPSFADWLKAQRENPSAVLKPYLQTPAAPATATEPAKPAAPVKDPPKQRGDDTGIGTGAGAMTADKAAEIFRQFRTGRISRESDSYKAAQAYIKNLGLSG